MGTTTMPSPAQRDLFKAICSNAQVCFYYEEFLRQTYAWENFGFWRAVQEYQKQPSVTKATQIFAEFLEYDAVHECGDFEPYHRESVKSQIQTGQKEIFDILAQFAVNSLVASTVHEFFSHQLYQEYESEVAFNKSSSSCVPCRLSSQKRNKCSSIEQVLFPQGFSRVVPLGYL